MRVGLGLGLRLELYPGSRFPLNIPAVCHNTKEASDRVTELTIRTPAAEPSEHHPPLSLISSCFFQARVMPGAYYKEYVRAKVRLGWVLQGACVDLRHLGPGRDSSGLKQRQIRFPPGPLYFRRTPKYCRLMRQATRGPPASKCYLVPSSRVQVNPSEQELASVRTPV